MPIEVIVTAIATLIASIMSGSLVAILSYFFTRQKLKAESQNLQAQTNKVQAEAEKIRIESENLRRESARNIKTAIEISETTKDLLSQGKEYQYFKEASTQMENSIQEYIDDCVRRKVPPVVRLKLISVAMTYSWESFICSYIPHILEKTKAKLELDILFVDWEYLKNDINPRITDIDWVSKSKIRLDEVKNFSKKHEKYNERFSFRAKIYRNVPHWHGWLVNGDHLFLGRTDWVFDGSDMRPELRVGQNEYRHFDKSSADGTRRINLFELWQRYYFDFSSTPVCDNTSKPDKPDFAE